MNVEIVIPSFKRPDRLTRCLSSIINHTIDSFTLTVLYNSDKLPAVWTNQMCKRSTADIIFQYPDDVEFTSDVISNVTKAMVEYFPDFDGVIGQMQTNIPDGCDCACVAWGRKFLDRFPDKQIFCPDYKFFFVDDELCRYAKDVGKFHQCTEAKLLHHHPNHSEDTPDETYELSRRLYKPGDKVTLQARKDKGLLWGRDFERVNDS